MKAAYLMKFLAGLALAVLLAVLAGGGLACWLLSVGLAGGPAVALGGLLGMALARCCCPGDWPGD